MSASPSVGDGALRRACFSFHFFTLLDKESLLRKTRLTGNEAPARTRACARRQPRLHSLVAFP